MDPIKVGESSDATGVLQTTEEVSGNRVKPYRISLTPAQYYIAYICVCVL